MSLYKQRAMSVFHTMEKIHKGLWEVHASKRKRMQVHPGKNHLYKRCTSGCQEYSNYRVKWDKTLVTNKANQHHSKEKHLSNECWCCRKDAKVCSLVSAVISFHTVVKQDVDVYKLECWQWLEIMHNLQVTNV